MKWPALIALMTVSYLLHGIALKLLWGWFMVPTFALPTLSLTQSIGIGMTIGFLTEQHIPRDGEQQSEMIVHTLLNPLLVIVCGGIVHACM